MTGVERLERSIIDLLTRDGPAELSAINASVTPPVRIVSDVLRDMAARKVVICKKVNPAGRVQSAGQLSDSARLIWSLPGQTITPAPALRAGLTVVHLTPRRHRGRTRQADPFTEERPEPIEILARMAGRTNFITPKATASSTATVPVTPLDIAHAIATAPDKFGAALALAVACRRPMDYQKIEPLGIARVRAQLAGQRLYPGVVSGPKKFNARIAMQDAFDIMLAPALQQPWAVGAAEWGINKNLYIFIVKQALGVLEAAANTAAKDAVDFLFREFILRMAAQGMRHGAVVLHAGGIELRHYETAADIRMEEPGALAFDIADLLEQTITRPRTPGVLSLAL